MRDVAKPIVIGLVLAIALAIVVSSLLRNVEPRLVGNMYINDAGMPPGLAGFEWVGEYNVSTEDRYLVIRQVRGLGDYLEKHRYRIIDLRMDGNRLILEIETGRIVMVRSGDEYVAVYSISERFSIGEISPEYFPGLPSHFYVELRLRPVEA